MRMNYKTYPTDYVQQLKQNANRKKARAFMEYWDDMEHGDHNAIRFYAKSWDVSVGCTSNWIKEFNNEIDLFLAHWDIRNKQHYNYAKNQSEQKVNTLNTNTPQEIGVNGKVNEHEVNEALNIYNNNNKGHWAFDKDFNDLYFVYGANTKFKGKKEEAFEAFKNVSVDVNLLKLASMRYLHDPLTVDRRYNLTNFLKNEIYLSYLPKRIRLTLDGVERIGIYDANTLIFKSETDSFVGQLSSSRLVELFETNNIEFLKI